MKTSRRKRGLSLRARNALTGYAFMAPWLIGLLVITAYPICYSLFLSTQQVRVGIHGIETSFVGLYWYKQAIFSDADFLKALTDTLRFICFPLPVIVVVSLIIAVLLNNHYPLRGFFRTIFFFPVIIISGPVIDEFITNGISTIGNPSSYSFYQIIARLPGFLSTPLCYIIDNIVIILWFSGVQILMYLSGLQKIGRPVFEAAQIDGAGALRTFASIALPLCSATLIVSFLFSFVCYWNETYQSGIFYGEVIKTLPMRLKGFVNEFSAQNPVKSGSTDNRLNEGIRMAGTFLTIAPLIILYAFMQRKFIEGIERTGLTGE